MCEFKYCQGAEACFLKDISPCPGVCNSSLPEPSNDNIPRASGRSRGFVDREALVRALGVDDGTSSVQSAMRMQRVSNKLLRTLQVMELRAQA